MSDSLPPPLDTPELALGFRALWQGKWIVVAVTAAAVLLGGFYAYRVAAPVYRTHVTIMLDPQAPKVIDIGSVLPGLGRDDEIRNSQIEVLRSRELIGKLVREKDLTLDPEFNESLRKAPDFSLRGWVRGKLESHGLLPPKPVPDLTPEAVLQSTISNLIRRIEVENHQDSLVFSLAIGTRDARKSADIVNGLARIYVNDQVESKLAATEQATTWLSGRVADLRADLLAAETAVQEAGAEYGFPTRSRVVDLERSLTALKAQVDTAGNASGLQQRIDSLAGQIAEVSAQLVDIERLDREAAATRILYDHFLARLKETAIQEDVHKPDARILSYAVVPQFPAHPKPLLILSVSLILGGGGGALLALARAQWQGTYRSAEALSESVGLPVLAAIPENTDKRRDTVEVMQRKPDGLLAEHVRDLRTSILLSRLDHPPRVIALTSALPEEGRTTTALMLAQTLAGWGRKVLLIEADIQGRSLARRYGLGERPGIMSVLTGLHPTEEALIRPDGLDTDLLVSEAISASASDIFATDRFAGFLDRMRESHDYIIIDAPPVLCAPETRSIAAVSDATLLLVRWNRTRRGQVRRAIGMFRQFGLPLAGTVLTRMPHRLLLKEANAGRNTSGRHATDHG